MMVSCDLVSSNPCSIDSIPAKTDFDELVTDVWQNIFEGYYFLTQARSPRGNFDENKANPLQCPRLNFYLILVVGSVPVSKTDNDRPSITRGRSDLMIG